jgi:CheY-like chemotaxis protein
MTDYYAILEVTPDATPEEIREQYLLLIQAWHPDKFPNAAQKAKAEEKCKQINSAYDVLKDAEKRARYDRETPGPHVGPREGESWEAELRRHRREAEAARQQATQRPHPSQPAEPPRHETAAERRVREEEWIRIYFQQARRRQSGRPAPAATGTVRTLIVSDGREMRALIRNLLSSDAGIEIVGEALNGMEAVQQYDLLLPDVMVAGIAQPSLGSLAATEAVRRRHPLAKVVLLSAHSSSEYVRQAALVGVCDYLLEPAAAGELQYAVRLAMGKL